MQIGGVAIRLFKAAVLLVLLSQFGKGACSSLAEENKLEFSLPKLGSEEVVRLTDFKDEIVVLDFFAHWCAPCVKSSPQIESGIQSYYAARGGNSNGIPVRVVGVNIDDSDLEKTSQFVERARLGFVLNDVGGSVFSRYGGGGIPYIVVVDMTGDEPVAIYRSAGFRGVDELRATIDGVSRNSSASGIVGTMPGASQAAESLPMCSIDDPHCNTALQAGNEFKRTGASSRDIAIDSALLDTTDVLLLDSVLEYNFRHPDYRLTAALMHGYIGVDFVPYDTVLDKTKLDSQRLGAHTAGHFSIADPLVLTVGGGAYTGFMDYKSLWLDEYYRQLYGQLPGYQEADPWGCSLMTDLRWEYLPSCGFIQTSLSYQYDIIAPSYERDISTFPPVLVRGNDQYKTIGGGLSLENVLTSGLRTLQELQLLKTTSREPRMAFKSSFNYAINDSLICRTEASASKEDPSFTSWSVGSTLEKDWDDTWFLSFSARYYEDTGQIEIALPGNSSAPPVRTYQGSVGIRWQNGSNSVKFLVGPYINQYLEAPADAEFSNLYLDREWVYVNLAYNRVF